MTDSTSTVPRASDFIRDIVAADLARRPRRRRSSRASRPSPTATSTSATRSRSASTSASRASSAAAATSASTTRTRSRRSRSTSTRSRPTSAGWASTGASNLFHASRLLRAALRLGRPPHPGGQGLRRRPVRRRDPRAPRHAHRARARTRPCRDRPVDENLDLFARMRAGEFPNGARVLRAKIDMASPEHQPARPRPVPDRPRDAPADGRRVVHLPDVRLRPRPVGRDRGRDALALHARVRGPPPALRLAHREPAGPVATRASTSSRGST